MLRPERTTSAIRQSPRPPASDARSADASPATGSWPTQPADGPTQLWVPLPAPATTTTSSSPVTTDTTRRSDNSPIGSLASSTVAFATNAFTTRLSPGPPLPRRLLLDSYDPWDVLPSKWGGEPRPCGTRRPYDCRSGRGSSHLSLQRD